MTLESVELRDSSEERQPNPHFQPPFFAGIMVDYGWEPDREGRLDDFEIMALRMLATEPMEEVSAGNEPVQLTIGGQFPSPPESPTSYAWHELSHQDIAEAGYRSTTIEGGFLQFYPVVSGSEDRLSEVNQHFRRKAAAVFNDEAALGLLASMHSERIIETSDFDFCHDGRALAKLTAAHFCEVGANSVYITHRGQRYVDYLNTK